MKFILSCVATIMLFSSGIMSFAKEYSITPSQKHFTAIIKGLPGVVAADWESPISLYVQASAKALGSPAQADKAQRLSAILAERGRTALKQPFCVHIYQTKGVELARSCTFY